MPLLNLNTIFQQKLDHMKNFTTNLLLFFAFLIFSMNADAAVNPPAEKAEKIEVQVKSKDLKARIKTFKKTHKAELKGLNKQDKKAFIADGINRDPLIPNGWLPVGIVLLIIGAIMALFGGLIAWVGGVIAVVGLAFVIVWLIKEVNSPY